jgi:hypothetical protein
MIACPNQENIAKLNGWRDAGKIKVSESKLMNTITLSKTVLIDNNALTITPLET